MLEAKLAHLQREMDMIERFQARLKEEKAREAEEGSKKKTKVSPRKVRRESSSPGARSRSRSRFMNRGSDSRRDFELRGRPRTGYASSSNCEPSGRLPLPRRSRSRSRDRNRDRRSASRRDFELRGRPRIGYASSSNRKPRGRSPSPHRGRDRFRTRSRNDIDFREKVRSMTSASSNSASAYARGRGGNRSRSGDRRSFKDFRYCSPTRIDSSRFRAANRRNRSNSKRSRLPRSPSPRGNGRSRTQGSGPSPCSSHSRSSSNGRGKEDSNWQRAVKEGGIPGYIHKSDSFKNAITDRDWHRLKPLLKDFVISEDIFLSICTKTRHGVSIVVNKAAGQKDFDKLATWVAGLKIDNTVFKLWPCKPRTARENIAHSEIDNSQKSKDWEDIRPFRIRIRIST